MALLQANFTQIHFAPDGKAAAVEIRQLASPTSSAPVAWKPSSLPLAATIGGKLVVYPSIQAKFHALAEAWRWHNRGRSTLDYDDFSYLQIIGMGPAVVPSLLEGVRDGMGFWYFALKCITNGDADTPQMRGDPEAIRAAWLEWGKRNDQLPTPRQALSHKAIHQS